MFSKKLEKQISNEEGSGLILALMVLLVLSVLGASLGVVTIGSLQLSDTNRDSNSAYYVAEAGANLAYEEFKEDVGRLYLDSSVSDKNTFFEKVNNPNNEVIGLKNPYNNLFFERQFENQPEAQVVIRKSNDKSEHYVIESTGEVGGKKRTVEKEVGLSYIEITKAGDPLSFPENVALIANDMSIDLSRWFIPLWPNKTVDGDLYLEHNNPAAIKLPFWILIPNDSVPNIFVKARGWRQVRWLFRYFLPVNRWQERVKYYEPEKKEFSWEATKKYVDNLAELSNSEIEVFHEFKLENNEAKLEENNYKLGNSVLKNEEITIKIEKADSKEDEVEEKDDDTDDEKENEEEKEDEEETYDGNATLFVENLVLEDSTVNVLGSQEGTLTIVVTEKISIVNTTFNPGKYNVRIVSTDGKVVNITGGSTVYGQIIAPESGVLVDRRSQVIGSIIADKATIKNNFLSDKKILKAHTFKFSDKGAGDEEVRGNVDDLFIPGPAIEAD